MPPLLPLFVSNYTALWFESKWKRSSRSGAVRRKQRRRLNSNKDEEKEKKRFAASFDHFIFFQMSSVELCDRVCIHFARVKILP